MLLAPRRAVVPRILGASVALFCLVTPAAARADDPPPSPAYRLRLDLDLSVVLIGGGVASSFLVLDEGRIAPCPNGCDRSRINFLDRPAAGLYNEAWDKVGNVAVAGTIALPAVSLLLYEGLGPGLNDLLVVGESALLGSALQVLTSYAVGRPRPRVYGDKAPLDQRTDANAARSFFSGHVANTMAVTVSTTRTFQRLGQPGCAWIVLAAGTAASSLVAVARVMAGAHFPTDTMVGAAVGAGLGLALPALHDAPVRLMPAAVAGGSILSLTGELP